MTSDVLSDGAADFNELLLPDVLLKGLQEAGFSKPSPVQLRAIPLARTGHGKFCCFVLFLISFC